MSWEFRCPRCGKVSHNENDAKFGYCGACHDFTGRKFRVERCMAPGCDRPVEDRFVLCEGHWRAVPRELQQDFYRARYKFEQGLEGGEILVSDAVRAIERFIDGK